MDDARCTRKGEVNCGATDRCREQQEGAGWGLALRSIHGTSETTRATQQTGLRRSRGTSLHSEPELGPNKQTRHKRWVTRLAIGLPIDIRGALKGIFPRATALRWAAMENPSAFSRKNRLGFHLNRRTYPSSDVRADRHGATNRAGHLHENRPLCCHRPALPFNLTINIP